jgi:PAS domain-containing protein
MFSRDAHESLVARLYSSAVGDAPWTVTLQHLSDLFEASASVLAVMDIDGRPITSQNYGYSPEFAAAYYGSEVYARDPRVPHFQSVQPGSLYFDHALYDVETMNRDARVRASNDLLKLEFQLGAVLDLAKGQRGYLAVMHSAEQGHSSEAAVTAYRRLAPHMQQACALGQLLEHTSMQQAVLLEALGHKTDGVILLDRRGAPGFLNDAARTILGASDGLAFTAGAFQAAKAAETRRLHCLINAAIAAARRGGQRPGGRMLVTRPSGRRPYVLNILPAPPVEQFLTAHSAACVVHLHDLAAAGVPSKDALIQVFGLTEREADLGVELVRCAGLTAASANAGMTINTARNHLQSIFRKCGAASQAEVVQLFGRLG